MGERSKDLSLALAATIRHDGNGGVADDLDTLAGAREWVREHADALGVPSRFARFALSDADREAIIQLRQAVRALFAHAVAPAPPSRADAHRLLPLDTALTRVNAAASRVSVTPELVWPASAPPASHLHPAAAPPLDLLLAAIARATIAFLAGPDRELLRACTAPRCVRYFLKGHGRQEFCKPSCSNRARVARHYARHHPT